MSQVKSVPGGVVLMLALEVGCWEGHLPILGEPPSCPRPPVHTLRGGVSRCPLRVGVGWVREAGGLH